MEIISSGVRKIYDTAGNAAMKFLVREAKYGISSPLSRARPPPQRHQVVVQGGVPWV